MKMTQESIDAFLDDQKENGASNDSRRQRKGFVSVLYPWRPDDKSLAKERLCPWQEDMRQKGYARQTIPNDVKGRKLYPDDVGPSSIRLAPTDDRYGKDAAWHCERGSIAGTQLLLPLGVDEKKRIRLADTPEHFRNGIYSDAEEPVKARAGARCDEKPKTEALAVARSKHSSVYPGVSRGRQKWKTNRSYKGKQYTSGCFDEKDEAIAVRKKAEKQRMEGQSSFAAYRISG